MFSNFSPTCSFVHEFTEILIHATFRSFIWGGGLKSWHIVCVVLPGFTALPNWSAEKEQIESGHYEKFVITHLFADCCYINYNLFCIKYLCTFPYSFQCFLKCVMIELNSVSTLLLGWLVYYCSKCRKLSWKNPCMNCDNTKSKIYGENISQLCRWHGFSAMRDHCVICRVC
jgi:hypothetical protein